jgi:hypothetical protein
METAPLTASIRIAGAIIDSSLFASADDAGIPDAVAIQIAEIFSGDIDFHRELRKGDRYSVVYEVLEGDGEPLRAGRVLSAEFVNAGKAYQALWFKRVPAQRATTVVRPRGAVATTPSKATASSAPTLHRRWPSRA